MRWALLTLLVAWPLAASAQWQRLQPHYSIVGFQTLNHYTQWVTMTGAGNGLLTEGASPPGSSGPAFWIHHTDNDWAMERHVGGSGGDLAGSCCTSTLLDIHAPATAFYYKPYYSNWGPVHSISVIDGAAVTRAWVNFPAPILMMSAMNDTSLYAIHYLNYGSFFSVRRTVNQAQQLGPIPGLPRQLDFLDTQTGALLFDFQSEHRELRVTHDGGISWNAVLRDPSHSIRHVQWAPDGSLWLACDSGLAMRSSDLGQTWDSLPRLTNEPLLSVSAYDRDSAWVGGLSGLVAATGPGSAGWTLLPVDDAAGMRVQVFPGAVYASSMTSVTQLHGVRRIYRYGYPAAEPDPTPQTFGWAHHPEGIQLFLEADEAITAQEIHDAAGRQVVGDTHGGLVGMAMLARGVYHLRIVTNKREVRLKIPWPGLD